MSEEIVIKNFPLVEYKNMTDEIAKLKDDRSKMIKQLSKVEDLISNSVSTAIKRSPESPRNAKYSSVYVEDLCAALGLKVDDVIQQFVDLYGDKPDEGYQE